MNGMRNLRSRRSRGVDINMAPLIDMIFILLIFFLVTTSFVKESGVEVRRPVAQTAETKEKANMIIGIDEQGHVHIEGKRIDVRSVRSRMEQYLMQTPKGSVVIAADERSRTDTLIQVLDACRLAGVQNISIAARKPQS
jgi:biopolymer transport protein ExbD